MSLERINGLTLYFVASTGPSLGSEDDALDLLSETYGQSVDMLVVEATRFAPEFFDLKSRVAGHFMQELENYSMRLAVVGDLSGLLGESQALRDFVTETNRRGHHIFATDRAALLAALAARS